MNHTIFTSESARSLYETVADLPLICPHGHVDPALFSDESYCFGTPVDLFLIPDHYIFRMLYSQGLSLESLAISRLDGGEVETDHRRAWQLFADHWHLFQGTPTRIWLEDELRSLFGIEAKLTGTNAQEIYDRISENLASPEFSPRRLYARFNIEVLATTDAATDTLDHHQAIRASGWTGRVVPTFRPDAVVNLDTPGWGDQIQDLSAVSGIDIVDYASYIAALEQRRTVFRQMGATATDHAALTASTAPLSPRQADAIIQQALAGRVTASDALRFTAHMLSEMARMSTEDGLVMQLHVGSYRNHNAQICERFGSNMGADIPISAEFTQNLHPLLNRFGNHPNFSLILFTLDESSYARELAPLAGHYPAVKLGAPWWFNDSPNGIRRYFDSVMETAGIYNTAGFNDDTRAFPSIPARHTLWRRMAAEWVSGLLGQQMIDEEDAVEMMRALAYDLAKAAYRL